jgi:hypothetical protein
MGNALRRENNRFIVVRGFLYHYYYNHGKYAYKDNQYGYYEGFHGILPVKS